MSDWKKYYEDHLVTMDKAAAAIVPGDKIMCGQTIAISYSFLNEINKREDLKDVTILYQCSTGMIDMAFDPKSKERFKMIDFFASPIDRKSNQMGIVDFAANPYSFMLRCFQDVYGCNTIVAEICPPDKNGRCNLGVLGIPTTGTYNASNQVTKRIGIINKYNFPAPGDYDEVTVPITDFDFIVIDDHEPTAYPVSEPTPVDKEIAAYIIPYIHDGDSLQIGMGGLGEEITKHLTGLKDIKIFTEIAGDSMVDRANDGSVVSLTACGAIGSSKIYKFLSEDSRANMKPLSYMLDPQNIRQVENIVGINQTLMIDLLGQACSEAQGVQMYSGVGGSFDFIYGINNAKGGRNFLCLRSTYTDKKGGVHSNIVPWLPEKSIVTTPKYLVMYVVTEYGVANVFLKSNRDRIKALISIAHPDFRAELKEQIISTGMICEEDF